MFEFPEEIYIEDVVSVEYFINLIAAIQMDSKLEIGFYYSKKSNLTDGSGIFNILKNKTNFNLVSKSFPEINTINDSIKNEFKNSFRNLSKRNSFDIYEILARRNS